MRVVGGTVKPDAGHVVLDGERLPLGEPRRATSAGVAFVHQHFSLVGAMTVWENVGLGDRGKVNSAQLIQQIDEVGRRYGMPVDPRKTVSELSPGERQRVEIVKCLRKDPKLIILDEPTSVLSQTESRQLFAMLRELVAGERRAVVLISHRLEEVMRATDRVVVMCEGAVSATVETRDTSESDLARRMLGRDFVLDRDASVVGVDIEEEVAGAGRVSGTDTVSPNGVQGVDPKSDPALDIRDAIVVDHDGRRLLDNLTLTLASGEILGVAGVEGNGQAGLLALLSGMTALESGSVRVQGSPVDLRRRIDRSKVSVIPAERHALAGILSMSVAENLALTTIGEVSRCGILSRRRLKDNARALVHEFGIVTSSLDAPLWSLSGGNQQRVVLARELSRSPTILVAGQPTQGLDVGAMQDVWKRLRKAAQAGCAVLLVSTDLDEVLALSDRIVVLQRGRIAGAMARASVDPDRLALLLGGRTE